MSRIKCDNIVRSLFDENLAKLVGFQKYKIPIWRSMKKKFPFAKRIKNLTELASFQQHHGIELISGSFYHVFGVCTK